MIKFEGVTKKFPNGTPAVASLSFEVSPGEFIFLVGPSGAGKTTILRLILHELVPTTGQIFVGEHNLSKITGGGVTQLRRKIGCVFQDLKLLDDRSVAENVALSLFVLGKNEKEVEQDVANKLVLVGLKDKGDFFPAQLAGGELQRVAIARALAGDPEYLLADEPTGNIDDANAWKIVKILDKINKSGTTIIMATHNGEIVDTLGKRVIRLEDGHIISDKKGKYRE